MWWSHVKKFYNEDYSAAMGLRMVPKLKYDHLHISSFSAMRVDLAAQVQVLAALAFAKSIFNCRCYVSLFHMLCI